MSNSSTNSTPPLHISILQELDANVGMNLLRLLIALNTIGTNGFLLSLFWRFKKLRVGQCNKLICLNALMDFLAGFGPAFRGIFQFYILAHDIKQFARSTCILISIPYTFCLAAIQATFVGLAFDRLMSIARPLKYREKKKFTYFMVFISILIGCVSQAMVLIGIDWARPSTQCSVAINAGPYFSHFWTLFNTAMTIVIFVIYMAILVLFFKHKSAIAAKVMPNSAYHDQVKQREMKLTMTIVMILLNYTFGWAVPIAIWLTFNMLDPTNIARMNYVSYAQGYVTTISSGMNLYIYLLKHTEIRNYALQMVGKKEMDSTMSMFNTKTAKPTQMTRSVVN